MPLKNRRSAAGGVITIHTPNPLDLKSSLTGAAWKDAPSSVPESRRSPYRRSASMRNPSSGRGGAGGGGRETEKAWVHRPPRGPWADWLSHASFRRLQAKLELEHREAGKITQPLLDTENGFLKDLERFLSHHETVELRRRELLHRRWTERVWTPIQKRVEDHVTHCCSEEAERMRSMFMHYIQYCNSKGFVFLENYDPQEYNPFLLNINKPHFFKVRTPALRDPLFFQSRERMKEKRAVLRCQTGHVFTRREVEEVLKNDLSHLAPPRSADLPLLAPPSHQGSTPREPLVEVDTELRKLSRTSGTAAYQFTATPDGRCLQTSCWSTRG